MKLIPNLAHIDQQASQHCNIPGLTLMEHAGRAVFDAVLSALPNANEPMPGVVLLCGPGNNGGDGFVCARLLSQTGRYAVTVLHTQAAYHGDAEVNFRRLQKFDVRLIPLSQAASLSDSLKQSGVVVDALFGSGLSRPIDGELATLIAQVNALPSRIHRIAVDLPSGVDCRTGQLWGSALRADATVTLAASKPGLHLYPGKALSGTVQVADIGIPARLIAEDESPVRLVSRSKARTWLPKRHPAGHKYTFGSVVVVAGSRDMPGAAVMGATAALHSGCGYVTLAAPASVFERASLPPEIVQARLSETPAGAVSPAALDELLQVIRDKKANAVAIGPGLGQSPDTVAFLGELLRHTQTLEAPPVLILDADALNALALLRETDYRQRYPNLPEPPALNPRCILTPHVGEAARLLARDGSTISTDLLQAASDLQQDFGAQVVLKSATTVCADHNGLLWINDSGNAGMAKAGSGDVLTGLIAGLSAQGAEPAVAARLGVYLHGLAGDAAAQTLTPYAMCAGQLIQYFPYAFKELMS